MARFRLSQRTVRSVLAGQAAAVAGTNRKKNTPASRPHANTAAFFDLDNTVLRGAAIFYLARGLAARKFFSTRDVLKWIWWETAFRIGGSERAGHINNARETGLSFIRGHRVDELTAIGEEIFDKHMVRKIWPHTRSLAQAHLDMGQQVWLVTATPIEVAATIAKRLGLTGALGTVAESADGVYTGHLVGEPLHGRAKAEAVRALADREGLDLALCSAYSDSTNDLPLLSMVGHPCAINPDRQLRRHAKAHGWRIRDFRTGRQAARFGLPAAAGVGALAGGVMAGVALRRKLRLADIQAAR